MFANVNLRNDSSSNRLQSQNISRVVNKHTGAAHLRMLKSLLDVVDWTEWNSVESREYTGESKKGCIYPRPVSFSSQ